MDELRTDDPRQVGRYTLLARIGAGGMGDVYYGRSPGGRPVAVKVIRADLASDQSFRLRFAREVAAARRVSGAFTAPVIDADPDAPVPWLVTGYVHGPSLTAAVERHGPLPPRSVLALAAGLAEGLGAVHAAGLVHRDLKPANVLLAPDGPRLIDFGISQAADFAQITQTGMTVGTPGFMPPEQITGKQAGPGGDVFALGAILAYAATGEMPFGSGPPELRNHRVLHLAPRLDGVPGELRPLVERCLAREPADRPTAARFLADLVAAHPEAADQADWLPAVIVAETRQRWAQAPPGRETPRRGDGAAPGGAEAAPDEARTLLPGGQTAAQDIWAGRTTAAMKTSAAGARPAVGAKGRRPRRRSPAFRAGVALAVIAAVAGVISLLAAPSGAPAARPAQPTAAPAGPVQLAAAPARPAGLVALAETVSSVEIAWNGSTSGPGPGHFTILKNGSGFVSVPGSVTDYTVTGLSPGVAYRFSVIAVTGTKRSAPSSTITASTYTSSPSLVAGTPFNWSGTAGFTETASSDSSFRPVGTSWYGGWSLSSNCGAKPCATTLYGTIDGWNFTATLARHGAVYSGSTPVDDYWTCVVGTDYVNDATLHITLTAKTAGTVAGQPAITSFAGNLTLDIPRQDGCAASAYQMRVRST